MGHHVFLIYKNSFNKIRALVPWSPRATGSLHRFMLKMICVIFCQIIFILLSELLVPDVRLEVSVPGADGGVPAGVHEEPLVVGL